MVKHLLLIRHAEAELPSTDRKDHERPLSQKGLTDASRLGKKLDTADMRPDIILCSTARRAQETASRLAEQVFFDIQHINFMDELYEASVRTYLKVINEADDKHSSLCIIGHNPTLSYFAEYLIGDEVGNISPGGMVHINFETGTWAAVSGNTGHLVSVSHPE
ncbi:histidine phosphatase family protein [Roseivirga sp. BDSF3-8]|uniref:SixA phosphatase family protein n=1 Tax=Roseivirga sp. BDSF3-8 TaxID=3241598 RepID=UPI0035323A2D